MLQGHEEVVEVLLGAGADVDQQDKGQWSSLMWAMANRHKGIAKLLLDHGASPAIKSSSGRTAFDFAEPESEIAGYLRAGGYIGSAGVGVGFNDDFYDSGLAHDKFEEEMVENELKRRMMMESAINLEVDLSSLGLDEQAEVSRSTPSIKHPIDRSRCRQEKRRRKDRSFCGIGVCTIRCLSSRNRIWTGCWTW